MRDFALNETSFINPKSMLKDLKKKELITVLFNDPRRRKSTFNVDKIDRIVFKGGDRDGAE